MRHVTECVLCEQGGTELLMDLVRIEGSPYGLASLQGQAAQFVVCRACGFVFQNPTLDEGELSTLYQGEYRTADPPDEYLEKQRQLAVLLCDWIESVIPGSWPYRRVLDIGCGAGCFLAEFARRGWEAVGIDGSARWTEWGRRRFGLDLRAALFGQQGLPGERFSLVLFSHVIEHLPTPLPTLQAIRRCLDPNGVLFVGAPNVLLPPTHGLERNFMAGPHVCAYSPRSIRRILAKAGFEVCAQDNWVPRGLRVVAKPTIEPYRPEAYAADDWKVIAHLYDGLTRGRDAGSFANNVAALIPQDFLVLEEISRKGPPGTHRIQRENGRIVNIEVGLPSGSIPLLNVSSPQSEDRRIGEHGPDIAEGGIIVLIGLGFGEYALSLLPHLERYNARLVIYEPDAYVMRTAFAVRDLTTLLRSKRVRLCVGPGIRMTGVTKRWLRTATRIAWRTDPMINRTVHRTLYEPVQRTFERWCDHLQEVAA